MKIHSLFIFFLVCSFSCQRPGTDRPNILVILADDLGYSDIGCYGGDIETPNLDRLAENGIRFTRFYNTARCCPSRASLLTGLHPHQAGMGAMVGPATDAEGYQGDLNKRCVTLAEVLGTAGYSTYMAGKWHVARSWDGSDKHSWPLQRGFERYFGTIYGAGSYFDPRLLVRDNDTTSRSPDDFYYTDAISDTSILFLEDHMRENPEKPFFMYVTYTAPHWPMHAKPEDIEKYRGRFDEGWDRLREKKVERMKSLELVDPDWEMFMRDPRVSLWDSVENKHWELRRMEVFAAMVDCMDQGIGRILNFLEQSGQMDNTLILFLSDNGGCQEAWTLKNPWATRYGPKVTRDGKVIDYSNDGRLDPGPPDTYYSYGMGWARYSNTPFSGYKSGTREGGISTPMIVRWPGRIPDKGMYRKQMAGIIDIMPTLVEVAGARYPEVFRGYSILPMEGMSLVGCIRSDEPLIRDAYYVEHIGRGSIIDGEGIKAVRYGRRPWQLYDLNTDRTETNDLAPVMPEKTEELAGKWKKWAWRAKVLPKPT